MGAKSKPKKKRHTTVLKVTMTEEFRRKVLAEASRYQQDLSSYVRLAVTEKMERDAAKPGV